MEDFFTIIGGMGTAATESFIHLLNSRTQATKDQEYLNYILVNHATIPDRTDFILGRSSDSPVVEVVKDLKIHSALGPEFFVLPCNTIHYFYDELVTATDIPIINMIDETVSVIASQPKNSGRVFIMATEGTITSGIFSKRLLATGLEPVVPDEIWQEEINSLIYHDVKESNQPNPERYFKILDHIESLNVDTTILGCTELSVVEEYAPAHSYNVVDAQSVLVDATLQAAGRNNGKHALSR